MLKDRKIAVVIPAYRVKNQIMSVLDMIGEEVDHIFVVDDHCPQGTGDYVKEHVKDDRVTVIRHEENKGVGGATLTGMRKASDAGADIIVKIDGDGQHNPKFISQFILPILQGKADYTKGNRFYQIEFLRDMPGIRLFGNTILSFMSKLSSGYWDLFDPTNGFIAIHSLVFKQLPADKIHQRFFFESDMLFRLYLARAKIVEIPAWAVYNAGESNLKPKNLILPFFGMHFMNSIKRLVYSYFLRNFTAASLMLISGSLFLSVGLTAGGFIWIHFHSIGIGAPTGMVVLPAILILSGIQFLVGFLSADLSSAPTEPIHPFLEAVSLKGHG